MNPNETKKLCQREQIEAREMRALAPYAAKAAHSRGRKYPETEDAYSSLKIFA